MKRRLEWLMIFGLLLIFSTSCGFWRIDTSHFLIRSPHIRSQEQEATILAKAKLEWTQDGRIRVLHLRGTPYERGYQHGALLRREVRDNLQTLYRNVLGVYKSEELFAEAYERARPYIPQEYIDEMHGLAHGAKLPLALIHHIHILPSITEWRGRKELRDIVKAMMRGELGTSCSNIAIGDACTEDGEFYAVRILDWGLHRISKLHEYPLISITHNDDQKPSYANIGWVGFLGAISGMNSAGITLGEMGYKDPPNERLDGKPMPFLLRDILGQAQNLADVRRIISTSRGDNSFVFLMTDGKTRQGEMYLRDPDRFVVLRAGQSIEDGTTKIEGLNNLVYGGHFQEVMHDLLRSSSGRITPQLLKQVLIPQMAMKSNFQNVIYNPVNLHFWVANAPRSKVRAAESIYTFFDLKAALEQRK